MPADPISTANAAVAHITGAIRHAARAVGTSFSYLMATAKVESNLNPGAKATTSSAQGLFQFIEQTWLQTMKEAGPRLGYGAYANAIKQSPSGRMEVADPAMRSRILDLRKDPHANAAMAGAFTNKNAAFLKSKLGRTPTEGELYIAHFLGAGGAGRLINEAATSNAPAARLFPNAASANRSVFYEKSGRARLASEVYANLTGRYEVARMGTAAQVAGAKPVAAPARAVAATPDPAGTTQAFAAYQPVPRLQNESGPVFHALFHTSERREAVAPRINQLWGTPPVSAQARAVEAPTAVPPPSSRPLDLFQDMEPEVRALFHGRG